jgi:hypothetical protein
MVWNLRTDGRTTQCRLEIVKEADIKSIVLAPAHDPSTLVENPIVHGFSQAECAAQSLDPFRSRRRLFVITIEDNGIGRKRAAAPAWSSSLEGYSVVERKN